MRYSADQLTAIDDIGRDIEALENVAQELCAELRACRLITAQVAKVPRPKKGNEKDLPAPHIQPEHLSGSDAFEAALYALTDWYGDDEHSTKAVARTPGAIVLRATDCQLETITRLFDLANAIKDRIKSTIPRLGNQDERFRLLHDHHRMLVTLQLIRHWTLFPPLPLIQSVTFSWGVKTEIKRVTVEELIEKVKLCLNDPAPEGVSRYEWEQAVSDELTRVSSLPSSTELRARRKLVVRPLANIRFRADPRNSDQRSRPVLLREAHTPLFLFSNEEAAIRVKPIGDYDDQQRGQRKSRGDRKCEEKPVTWLFPIYRFVG